MSPLLFSRCSTVNALGAKLKRPESAVFSGLRLSVLTFTLVSLGILRVVFLEINTSRAIAQIPVTPEQTPQINSMLFVSPRLGDDRIGNGSEGKPWRTITHALKVAQPNTVIILSTGKYTAETGEVFPLILKSNISIQGNPRNQGKNIQIIGGGYYLSRSFGGQNVAIVGANQAGLNGVTVTNPNFRGYGLWLESGNTVVQENTFTGSTQDGICVTGNAAPTISKNYFYRNGANGITILGNSQAQVWENVLRQTGFGINIAQNAVPLVMGNQIHHNRSGIVVQANARPILRNNLIQDNKEDGLVAISQAMPDLGSASEPGNNQFRNNARYDINAKSAKRVIYAFGNNLARNRIAGNVNIKSTITQTNITKNSSLEVPIDGEIIFSSPKLQETTNEFTGSLTNLRTTQDSGQPLPSLPANLRPAVSQTSQQSFTPSNISGFPVPSSLLARANTSLQSERQTNSPQLNYARIKPRTVKVTAPRTMQPRARDQKQTLPVLEPASIDANVIEFVAPQTSQPIARNQIQRSQTVSTIPTTRAYGGGSLPGVRYRVFVQIATDRERELVLSVAPDAFSTIRRGYRVMQVGVFSNEYNASAMLRMLSSQGLKARIEPLN